MPSGARDPKYWLYLEPYVHVSTSGNVVLFYNSLDGTRFELVKDRRTGRIVNRLITPENGYVAGLTDADMRDPSVRGLVSQLQSTFMGDLLNHAWSQGKPANIIPEPFFKSHLTRELITKQEARDAIDFDNYIHEVVLYLNNQSLPSGDSFPSAAKQFVFPGNTLEGDMILPWNVLEKFIRHVSRYKITGIHVSGAKIMDYPGLASLSALLAKAGLPAQYHIHTEHFDPAILALTKHRNTMLAVHITFPVDLTLMNRIIEDAATLIESGKISFHFVITSAEELETAQQIIAQTNLPNTWLNPYYNGRNFDFFRDTVFITKEDIAHSAPRQNQVFSRLTMNEKDFGKFTVLPDGSVYANLNDPQVGKLGIDLPEEMILRELIDGVSWTRTRKNADPCRNCLYHFLCPPVSSYELVMNRFNFCDVYVKPEK